MRTARVYLGLLAILLVSAPAVAAESEWDGGYGLKTIRRSDFALGVNTGLALGNVIGYPNELGKLDNRAYRANTNVAPGANLGVWLGVAFNDYFTFSVGGANTILQNRGLTAAGVAFALRAEAFPWFGYGRHSRDVGVFAEVGGGVLNIQRTESKETLAAGGSMSLLGLGAQYEGFRAGHFAFGPSVQYRHMWSGSMSSHTVLLELRAAFYGGP